MPAWDPSDVLALASPVPTDRAEAVARLYAQGWAWTVRRARYHAGTRGLEELRRQLHEQPLTGEDLAQTAWMKRPEAHMGSFASATTGEDLAQTAWMKLLARLEREPLSQLSVEDPCRSWTTYVEQTIRRIAIDEQRHLLRERNRRRTGPEEALLIGLLKKMQRAAKSDTEGLWLQEMIELARRGGSWSDPEELAQRTGAERARLQEFVRGVLAELRSALEVRRPNPDRLRALWTKMQTLAMNHYTGNSKADWVARAMFETDPTDGLFRGRHINQERVLQQLESLGQPWHSGSQPRAVVQHPSHAPGYPGARGCQLCAGALYQQCSRIIKELRQDAKFKKLWQEFCQERDVGSVLEGRGLDGGDAPEPELIDEDGWEIVEDDEQQES